MEINITQSDIPTREGLVTLLTNHFEGVGYTTKLFGYGYGKSIILSKSALVAARIFISDDKRKIIIRSSFGSPFMMAIPFLLLISTLFSTSKSIMNEAYDFLAAQYE